MTNYAASDFLNTLDLIGSEFRLEQFKVSSGTEGGDYMEYQRAWPKWRADYQLAPIQTIAERRRIQTWFEILSDAGNTFSAWDFYAQYPASDPTGSTISGASPTVNSVSGNQISLSVPTGYVITLGDKFTVNYGSSGRCMLRAMETVTSVSGATPSFKVTPIPRPEIAEDDVVDLTRPIARMKMVAWDMPTASGEVTTGASFSAVEA